LRRKRVPGPQDFGEASHTLRVLLSASWRLCASSLVVAATGLGASLCGEEGSTSRPPSSVCSVPSVSSVAEKQFAVDSSQFPVAAYGPVFVLPWRSSWAWRGDRGFLCRGRLGQGGGRSPPYRLHVLFAWFAYFAVGGPLPVVSRRLSVSNVAEELL